MVQRHSHRISLGVAKLSFQGAKVRWKGAVPEIIRKHLCGFMQSRFFFFFLLEFRLLS